MTTPHDDPLLLALRAADPVDVTALPDGDAPPARARLEELLMPTHLQALDELQRINAASTPTPLEHRRRRPLAMAAGAVSIAAALLLALLVLPIPGTTPEAAAAVRQAAEATTAAGAKSGRAESTFSVNGLPTNLVSSGKVTGAVEGAFSGTDLQARIDIDDEAKQVISAFAPDAFGFPFEVRLVQGVGYQRQGDGQWTSEPVDDAPTELDAREALAALMDVTQAREVGSDDIDGQSTTHYRATVKLTKEDAEGAVVGAAAIIGGVGAAGTVDIDLWVAPGDLIRRLQVVGTFDELPGLGQLTMESTTNFFDLGQNVVIEAPQ